MTDNVEAAAAATPTPIVQDASTTAYLKTGLTMLIRQAILFGGGLAAAKGLLPKDWGITAEVQMYIGIAAAVAVTALGQWREKNKTNKIVVLLDHVDDAIGYVVNAKTGSAK
jgi:hypothetical protein